MDREPSDGRAVKRTLRTLLRSAAVRGYLLWLATMLFAVRAAGTADGLRTWKTHLACVVATALAMQFGQRLLAEARLTSGEDRWLDAGSIGVPAVWAVAVATQGLAMGAALVLAGVAAAALAIPATWAHVARGRTVAGCFALGVVLPCVLPGTPVGIVSRSDDPAGWTLMGGTQAALLGAALAMHLTRRCRARSTPPRDPGDGASAGHRSDTDDAASRVPGAWHRRPGSGGMARDDAGEDPARRPGCGRVDARIG